jgi:hypothetical protein
MEFEVSTQSAELLREAHIKMGAFVTGRRTFDIAQGWGGNPLERTNLRRHPYGPTRMGLRGIAFHVRHRGYPEHRGASESGCG